MHPGQDPLRRTMEMRASATILLLLLGGTVLRAAEGSGEPWLRSEKHAELGTEVLLPCVLKSPQCEGLHSIKWYRGPTRIFIFSEDAGIIRGNNDIAVRADIEYSTNSSKTYLKIPDVKLKDEGLYKCEATYMAVNRECNNVQHITLNVTVQPSYIRVINTNSKNTLSTGTTLGPINEGSTISLNCESGEGKPLPTVGWFKGDQPLEATNSSTIADTGIGTASSLLEMQITRKELGATFTCKVNSIALVEPLTVDIKPDVHVRPLKMDLNGVVGHAVQGTKILLQCTVRAARPPANVTWQNGTKFLNESNERLDIFKTEINENEDGTSETISYLAFTASVYDNGKTFKCYAENSVTRTEDLKPMKETTTIEVLYPPIIKMKPNNLTVNETDDILIFCDYEANPASLIKVTWLRNNEELVLNDDHYDGGITEQTALTVKNATPSDIGSYKCILENNAGSTVSEDIVEVSVFHKPVVEVIMDPETPVNEADRLNVSLTCEVDSGNPATLTAVRWYLDGDLLKELPDCARNSTAVTTTTEESLTFCDIDPSKLLLEAVGRSFHGNYSCEGRNEAGWGPISPSTPVVVYFPPENITISKKIINVTVDTISETVACDAKARPKPNFRWFREGSNDTIMEGHVLDLKMPVPRRSNGTYYCEASNRHGILNISMVMNVQFKPECHIERERFEGKDYVICWVVANPKETNFVWSLKNDNDTLEQVAEMRNGRSYMLLDTSVTNSRTYVCVANNTIGYSTPCERDVAAHHGHKSHIPWWHQLEGNLLLIIIIVAVVIILVLILICVAIFIVCRRKHNQVKYPNQAANNNHVNSVSEGLPESGTKTFYENLPFHGIQAPPNKLVTPKFAQVSALHGTLHHSVTTSPCSSRPPSRAISLCDGSSGYESTRSHLGPHYNIYNVPRSNSPVLKYNTLKPRRRKQKHSQQFYSLRLCRRHENIRKKYELYAIPIYKTCPHKSDSTTTIATIVRSMEDAPSLTRSAPSPTPPVPAPRTPRKTDPSKHTYQNVPPPVFPPKDASLPKLKTDSLYNYKEHYQQQHRQEIQQYSYPLPSNSSNQLTLPLTRSLYHSSIVSPLQTSYAHTNNSRPSTLMHHEATENHLPAVHRDEEQQQQPSYGNHDARQSSRRHTTNRRNERNRKYRKHERTSADRKSKSGRRGDARRTDAFVGSPACETSFHQIADLGVPETYEISYPNYYEDDIAECPTDYHRPNSAARQQQQSSPQQQQQSQQSWERQSNRCICNNAQSADASDAKNRNKTSKRLSTNLGDARSPSAPTIMQYAELHFRDVGQEIDV
ncbi:PREDICTED: uncharacterized protein LOC106743787 isoform X4 [Dinoponera quadriceps]|uniref:Uncharacterized protein LOC106743787 isoform X4 n=1 Tax=Dinoponera quadriceps TaxID=609295 RepID=A0A6P3X6D6_DINQU|nr:PREDICTED: uncharacterized protein LOC106743787 isoform X4 [Dinoponera quadriceps]